MARMDNVEATVRGDDFFPCRSKRRDKFPHLPGIGKD
jgi:hypothetical protein